jgi:hypothetical protein
MDTWFLNAEINSEDNIMLIVQANVDRISRISPRVVVLKENYVIWNETILAVYVAINLIAEDQSDLYYWITYESRANYL